MSQKFLSTADVARLASVTTEAVRKWARTGVLAVAAESESGIRFFRRADVERLVRDRTRAKPPRDRRAARSGNNHRGRGHEQ